MATRRENRHEPQPSPSPAAGGHLDDVPPRATVSSFRGHNLGQRVNDVYCVEMAARLTGTGVTINVLMPGFVDTGLRLRRQFRSQYVLFAVSEVLTRPWARGVPGGSKPAGSHPTTPPSG